MKLRSSTSSIKSILSIATFSLPLILATTLTSPAFAISTPNDTVPGFVEKSTDDRGYSLWAGRDYPTHVYFGDTHHHTANSGDAFMNGDRLSPEDAYRFVRGEEVVSSSGVRVKLSRPIDFLVVSDHAEGLGVMYEVYNGNPLFMGDEALQRCNKAMKAGGKEAGDGCTLSLVGGLYLRPAARFWFCWCLERDWFTLAIHPAGASFLQYRS